MTQPHLTDAQLEQLLSRLAEVVEVCGEVYLPIFERALAEYERRQQLREKLSAFRKNPSKDAPQTAEQFS